MAEASAGLHENIGVLKPETLKRHRAIVSLMEELEAVDWYDQRVDATDDEELRTILEHNRDEEKEHACMLMEWIRRNDPVFDEELKTYLFTTGAITELEEGETEGATGSGAVNGSLGIGSLKEGGAK